MAAVIVSAEVCVNINIDIIVVNQGRVGHLGRDNSQGGALVENRQLGYQPADVGSLVYLDAGENLDRVLTRIEAASSNILLPKTPLGEYGFVALFKDTEGNKVGLRSHS
ncbi:MAG: hypothetical protein AAF267_17765 [Deinococcota bacterium]